jgi:glycosyltransferase involved in cell wall biosynthesis
MTPEIDVVIPVHNGAHLVTRAVESVVAQHGCWDLHIYLVDDGSTDDSSSTLRALKARFPRITILSNPNPRGVAAARNRAVAGSRSDLVAFLDQDDEWVPDKLKLQAPLFDADPGLMYSVGLQRFVLTPGQPRPSWCRPEWLEKPQAGFVPSTLLVRREAWKIVGRLDETITRGADDLDWFSRAREKNVPFVAVPEVLVNRYVHSDNRSSDVIDGNKGLLEVVRKKLMSKGVQHRDQD